VEEPKSPIAWRKSSRCEAGTCVEVAAVDGAIAMRDAKNPDGPVLLFDVAGWNGFLAGVRRGDYESA
jgi:hypothetical protein